MPSRRRLLQSSGLALAALAGCFSLEGEPDPVTVTRLSALNFHDEAHTLHARIDAPDADEPRYEASVELTPGEPREPSGATFEDHPEEVAGGVLRVWRDGRAPSAGDSFDFSTYGPADCVGFEAHVGAMGEDPTGDRVSMWHTSNCED